MEAKSRNYRPVSPSHWGVLIPHRLDGSGRDGSVDVTGGRLPVPELGDCGDTPGTESQFRVRVLQYCSVQCVPEVDAGMVGVPRSWSVSILACWMLEASIN